MLLWGHLLRFGKQSTDAVFIIASRDHTRNRDQVPPVGELRAAQQGAQGTLRAQLHVAWVVPQVGRGRVSENLLGSSGREWHCGELELLEARPLQTLGRAAEATPADGS